MADDNSPSLSYKSGEIRVVTTESIKVMFSGEVPADIMRHQLALYGTILRHVDPTSDEAGPNRKYLIDEIVGHMSHPELDVRKSAINAAALSRSLEFALPIAARIGMPDETYHATEALARLQIEELSMEDRQTIALSVAAVYSLITLRAENNESYKPHNDESMTRLLLRTGTPLATELLVNNISDLGVSIESGQISDNEISRYIRMLASIGGIAIPFINQLVRLNLSSGISNWRKGDQIVNLVDQFVRDSISEHEDVRARSSVLETVLRTVKEEGLNGVEILNQHTLRILAEL